MRVTLPAYRAVEVACGSPHASQRSCPSTARTAAGTAAQQSFQNPAICGARVSRAGRLGSVVIDPGDTRLSPGVRPVLVARFLELLPEVPKDAAQEKQGDDHEHGNEQADAHPAMVAAAGRQGCRRAVGRRGQRLSIQLIAASTTVSRPAATSSRSSQTGRSGWTPVWAR